MGTLDIEAVKYIQQFGVCQWSEKQDGPERMLNSPMLPLWCGSVPSTLQKGSLIEWTRSPVGIISTKHGSPCIHHALSRVVLLLILVNDLVVKEDKLPMNAKQADTPPGAQLNILHQ
jgi:hypothetical protein